MRPLWTLIKLYINSIFRFSVIRHSSDRRERRNAIMGIVAIGIIAVSYGFMSASTSAALFLTGQTNEAPFLMLCTMASVFVLVMAFSQGSATLSGFADFDTLMGMPIRTSLVVFARFLALYLVEAVYSLAFLLPCGILYGIIARPAAWFYPAYLVMTLLVPVLPVVIGSGADLLLSAAFAKSKYKKGITSTIKTVFLLVFVAGAYLLPRMTDRILENPTAIADSLSRIYPPAAWFAKGATGSIPHVLLYTLGSIVLCAGFLFVLNRTFLPLHDRLASSYHVVNYRLKRQRQNSVIRALFTVEARRFLNSTAWVLNTVIGVVLIIAIGIAGSIFSRRLIETASELGLVAFLPAILIGVLIFCATLAPTTACAISMEGKQVWISKQLPIPAQKWLRAKLYVNLALAGPALLVSITLLSIAFRAALHPLDVAGLYLLPVASLLCTTVLGLLVNAKMPRLSWKSDTEVVKQSGAVLIMMLICFALLLITVVPVLLFGSGWIAAAVCILILTVTGIVYGRLMKQAEQIRLIL